MKAKGIVLEKRKGIWEGKGKIIEGNRWSEYY
jgi:hypothetical protein